MLKVATVALCCLAITTAAQAQSQVLSASQLLEVKSSFTLDFGPFGGAYTADVANTKFELEVAEDGRTARFTTYSQNIDPITLPGGISTGPITVNIVDSQIGPFDGQTFETQDTYSITFDGDLSAFNLKSPVTLPSSSTGKVDFTTARSGTVVMDWAGQGALQSPFDATSTIPFTYTCHVEAVFNTRTLRRSNTLCGAFDLTSALIALAVPVAFLRRRRG